MGKGAAVFWGCIVPWLAYVVISPFFNFFDPKTKSPLILGMPPLMFWDILWIILTPFCLLIAYNIEKKGWS